MKSEQKEKLIAIQQALEKELGLKVGVAKAGDSHVIFQLLTPTGILLAEVGLGWHEYFEHWFEGSFEDHMARMVSKIIKSKAVKRE